MVHTYIHIPTFIQCFNSMMRGQNIVVYEVKKILIEKVFYHKANTVICVFHSYYRHPLIPPTQLHHSPLFTISISASYQTC